MPSIQDEDTQRLYELSAPELEELIWKLATERAQMDPPVPHDRNSAGRDVARESHPAILLSPFKRGTLCLSIRSSAVGWLDLILDADEAMALSAGITQALHDGYPTTTRN